VASLVKRWFVPYIISVSDKDHFCARKVDGKLREGNLLRDKETRTKDKLWPRLQRKINPFQEVRELLLERVMILPAQVTNCCL
jgi:hypothetical protein